MAPSSPSAPTSGLPIRLLVAGGALLAPILLVELGARAAGLEYPPLEIPIYLAARGASLDLASQTGLYLPDAHELWTPRPGARLGMISPDPDELINSQGFRGPELTLERKSGVLRIATLGDSSTFGVLVRAQETWSAKLPAVLAGGECINGGVVGFTARQGIERYVRRVRPYRPDVVVAAFGAINESTDAKGRADDVVIRERIASDTALARWRRSLRRGSRLVHGIDWILDRRGGGREAELELLKAAMIAENVPDPGVVAPDWPGVRRVSVAELRELLLQLASEVKRDGAQLVVVSMPRKRELEELIPVLSDYSQAIADACAAGELPFVDARTVFRAARAAEEEAELFANEQDTVHPSPLGHALIAEAVGARIAEIRAR